MQTQEIEKANEIRKIRGMEIAKTCRIMHRERGGYIVPSQSGSGCYVVSYKNLSLYANAKTSRNVESWV